MNNNNNILSLISILITAITIVMKLSNTLITSLGKLCFKKI